MRAIKQFQVRGIPGEVSRIAIGDRIIDYWAPHTPTDSVLIAHDGQNVFDGKTSTHRRRTWEIGQSVNRLSKEMGINPPAVIAIWNGNSPADPWARLKELAPEKVLRNGVAVITKDVIPVTVDQLYGDRYLDEIFSTHLPTIAASLKIELTPAKIAMIGSSMGGLSTLYALAGHGDKFHTALALSTHWSLGGMPLVNALINELPSNGRHNIYMSRGTKGLDADYEPFQLHADSLMLERGYQPDRNFVTRVHTRTGHNEKSWASYIDEPISFWLSRIVK
jgi:predicted alpha/beta superfamily hydrolase